MSKRILVDLIDVWKTYRTNGLSVDALRGVCLQVEEGEFVSIMGPSGSGKSTLLHVIGCLDKPTRGNVIFNGSSVLEMTESKLAEIRCRKIGFVFQAFNLVSTLNALDNVKMPMRFAKVTGKKQEERARQLLEKVGLGKRFHHLPNQLSGGEKQRVAIARALANNPILLLADEPTGNLDSISGSEIVNLLRELNDEGLTIIMVTHNPSATRYSNKVLQMKDGQLLR